MIAEIFKSVTQWYMGNINYGTITLLMAVESSFIPFPSEIVVPPAAFKAASGELSIFLVILFATVGAILGALFNYFIAYYLGRTFIHKFAKTRFAHLLLIDSESVQKAEDYFLKYGKSSTLIGRFVPVIRQLISLPAGLAKMNMKDFLIFTTIGSGLWNVILAVLGYFLYSQKELLDKYYKEISYVFLALGIVFVVYVLLKVFYFQKSKA